MGCSNTNELNTKKVKVNFELLNTINTHSIIKKVIQIKTLNYNEVLLAVCCVYENSIRIYNLNKPNDIPIILEGHSSFIFSIIHLKWKMDHNTLVSCSDDSTIKLWDYTKKEVFITLKGHKGPVICVTQLKKFKFDLKQVSNDIVYIASGGRDCDIRVWEANSGNLSCLVINYIQYIQYYNT